MDGIITSHARVDGDDATEQITTMINQSRFKNNIFVTLINGIAVGGFNVIDIEQLWKDTGIPVISVTRRYPNFLAIYEALHKLGMDHKITLIKNAGKPEQIDRIYIQCKGIKLSEAKNIIKLTCTRSYIPEPLRAAHIIATGIVKGESKGRA